MSYRDKKQSLEEPITKLLEGVKEFDDAVNERMLSNEWEKSYLSELDEVRQKLNGLRFKLYQIRLETW